MFGEMFSIYCIFIDHIVKSILLLISRLNENQALDSINRLSLIKEQLDNKINSNQKLFNFGKVMSGFSEKNAKKVILKSNVEIGQIIQQLLVLYIQEYRINAIITFIITLLLAVNLMAGFLQQQFLTIYIRHNMDSLTLMGGLIKTETIIQNLNFEYLNQTQAGQILIEFRDNLSPVINEVVQVISENANANNVKSKFNTKLNYDLCLSSTIDSMICQKLIKLQYDTQFYIIQYIKKIIIRTRLHCSINKFINQEFDYEILNLSFNETNKFAIQQQSFLNFILQYQTDTQTE